MEPFHCAMVTTGAVAHAVCDLVGDVFWVSSFVTGMVTRKDS